MPRSTIKFDTKPWTNSHMDAPKGRGSWAFQIDGASKDDVIFSPSMTYSEAKSWMRAKVRELNVTPDADNEIWVNVLP